MEISPFVLSMQSTLLLYFHFPDIIDKRRITLERVQFRVVSLHDITFDRKDTRREINWSRTISNVLIAEGLKGSFCLEDRSSSFSRRLRLPVQLPPFVGSSQPPSRKCPFWMLDRSHSVYRISFCQTYATLFLPPLHPTAVFSSLCSSKERRLTVFNGIQPST